MKNELKTDSNLDKEKSRICHNSEKYSHRKHKHVNNPMSTQSRTTDHSRSSHMTSPQCDLNSQSLDDLIALSLMMNVPKHDSEGFMNSLLSSNVNTMISQSLIDEISKLLLLNIMGNVDIQKILKDVLHSDLRRTINDLKEKESVISEEKISSQNVTSSSNSRVKKLNKCEHKDRPHYAKNLCKNCYHKMGRIKTAYKCKHPDRPLYAFGICKNCYQASYSRHRNNSKKNNIPCHEEIEMENNNNNIKDIPTLRNNLLATCSNEIQTNFIASSYKNMCENFSNDVEGNENFLEDIINKNNPIDLQNDIRSNVNFSLCAAKDENSYNNFTDFNFNENDPVNYQNENNFLKSPKKTNSTMSIDSNYYGA